MTSYAADEGEALEAGYGDSTPERDNLLLDYARGEADCFAAIVSAGGGRIERHAALGLRLADMGSPSPFGNTAHLTRPIGANETKALLDALRDFFDAEPGGPFLLFSPWPIGDLRGEGFDLVGHPPLMIRPSTVPVRPGYQELRTSLVETTDQLADFEQTLIEAYPVPEYQPWQQGSFLGPDILSTRWRLFVGCEGDRCVATAGAWLTDTVTIVAMVSTRDECRGKGYGAAITAAATHAEPGRNAMLTASDLGRSVYGKLGYLPLLRYTMYVGTRHGV